MERLCRYFARPAIDPRTPTERHQAMRRAQRLKRVFGIEIGTCAQRGGKVKVIASIKDPTLIGRIHGHLAARAPPVGSRLPTRGPPRGRWGFHKTVEVGRRTALTCRRELGIGLRRA